MISCSNLGNSCTYTCGTVAISRFRKEKILFTPFLFPFNLSFYSAGFSCATRYFPNISFPPPPFLSRGSELLPRQATWVPTSFSHTYFFCWCQLFLLFWKEGKGKGGWMEYQFIRRPNVEHDCLARGMKFEKWPILFMGNFARVVRQIWLYRNNLFWKDDWSFSAGYESCKEKVDFSRPILFLGFFSQWKKVAQKIYQNAVIQIYFSQNGKKYDNLVVSAIWKTIYQCVDFFKLCFPIKKCTEEKKEYEEKYVQRVGALTS